VNELQLTTRFTIHAGRLDEFKELAGRCMESVREKDSGTLQYDWFFSEDETECVLRERYRDSAAVLEHAANLGELMGGIMAVSDPQIEIYGAPSSELLEAIAGLQPRVYPFYRSI
jgi:quinol monooxygenase YgiN